MKRYMILSVGYQHVALPYSTGAELATLVSAISDGRQVNSIGYGEEQQYVPSSDEPVQFALVDAARVTLGDELATLKAQLKAAQEQAESNQKNWLTYYQKSQELEKELKKAQAPAPAAVTPEPPPPPQPSSSSEDELIF